MLRLLQWLRAGRLVTTFARALVQMPEAAPQRFDFLLVGVFLPFSQFEGFKHFLHVVQRVSERINDPVDLFNRLLHRCGRSGNPIPHGLGRRGEDLRFLNREIRHRKLLDGNRFLKGRF